MKQWFAEEVDAEWSKCEWVVALCMRAHAKPEKPALPKALVNEGGGTPLASGHLDCHWRAWHFL